jgi:glycosyltransferase involved in cell wall biosynthesis
MASGRPVILPDSNLGRHLEHEKNCLILQKGDAKEICKQLLFLARNPDVAESIGQAGREFAREHFSWDASAAALIAFYRRVLEDWKGRNNR